MMSQFSFHGKSPSAKRFARLNEKTKFLQDHSGFELSRQDLFLDGNIDIFDILAHRTIIEKDT